MSAKPRHLAAVPDEAPPEQSPYVNVSDMIRADIRKRDWEKVHIRGLRAAALDLPERVRRGWRL